jgi:thiol-disulfide isomerase/thioredoxin
MSGLLFLQSDDFFIDKGQKGDILCNTIRGLSLILFYSTECVFCQKFIPMFKTMPGRINGCQFGMINVSKNREVVFMAKNTIAPIKYVPYIILYVNGKPFVRYDGPHDDREIIKFVVDVASKLSSKEKFSSATTPELKDSGKEIPAYTIGIPKCDDDGVCYLQFDDAYHK